MIYQLHTITISRQNKKIILQYTIYKIEKSKKINKKICVSENTQVKNIDNNISDKIQFDVLYNNVGLYDNINTLPTIIEMYKDNNGSCVFHQNDISFKQSFEKLWENTFGCCLNPIQNLYKIYEMRKIVKSSKEL